MKRALCFVQRVVNSERSEEPSSRRLSRRVAGHRLPLVRFRFSVLAALLLLTGTLRSQAVYILPSSDTVFVYPCQVPSGVLCDNGGLTGNYTNNFEGWAILSVPSGVSITLTGSYATESGYDKIWIYDGHGANGTLLVDGVSGTGSINVTASSGWLTLRFYSDGSTVNSGFALTYTVSGVASLCQNPITNLMASQVTDTSAVLTWSATTPSGPFLVTVGDTTLTLTDTMLVLNNLSPNRHYDVTVTAQSDASEVCCMAQYYFRTLCGVMEAPVEEDFDDYGEGPDVLPACWVRQRNFDDSEHRYPQITSAQAYSLPGSLMMFCSTSSNGDYWSLAIGPEIGDDITSLYVRLKLRCAYSNAKLEVGVCSDTSLSGNGFVPVDTLTIGTANSWLDKVVSLASYSGNGNRIALRMKRSLQPSNSLIIYVDDMTIEPCGVWHMARQERSSTDMWVSWDLIGSPVVDIEVLPSGAAAGTGTLLSGVTSPCHIEGLEAGTTYTLQFYTSCNGIYKSGGTLTAATLARDARALNLCETFEGNGNNLPTGWRSLTPYSGTPTVSTSAKYGGTSGLYFCVTGSNRPLAVLPQIDTMPVSGLTVSFWARSYNYASGRIVVGVMQYPEYETSFVPVDTVDCPLSWMRRTVSLASYADTGRYIALRAYDQNGNYNYIYLDNLEVGPCLVTGQSVTNIASHSVDVLWDAVGQSWAGDSVTVEYGPAGFALGLGTTVTVSVDGADAAFNGNKQWLKLSGLDTNTTYDFVVYGTCAAMSQVCDLSRVSATTLEADPALPLCESFETYDNGEFPTGWARPSMVGSYPQVDGSVKHSGSRSMRMYAQGDLGYNHTTVVLPMLDVDSVQGLTVSFFTYAQYNGTSYMQVGVMSDPSDESTFVAVATPTNAYNSWKQQVVALSSYNGTGKYIAIRYYHSGCNNCSYSAWIDDLVVADAATKNGAVYSVTSHGATVSWNGVGADFAGTEVEWGPAGFVQGTGTRDTVDANTFTYTFDTLAAGVAYDVLLTALSDSVAGICNYARLNFTTASQPMQASWCYGFEDVENSGYPAGWTRPQTYSDYPRVYSDAHRGSRALYLASYNCNDNNHKSLAVLPYLEDTLGGLTLRFWAKGSGDYNEAWLHVGMMTHPTDPATFDTIASLNLSNGGNWQEYSVDLSSYSGTGRHLAFWQETPTACRSSWVYLDDLTLSRCRVKEVMSYSATTSSFVIAWSQEGATDSVELEWGASGFTPGSGTVVSNAVSPLTLTGLSLGTAYDFYVRPYCAGSGSVCAETKYSATTLSTPIEAGYCEDFEGYNNYGRPEGWTVLKGYDSHPYVWNHSESQYYTSAAAAFEMRCEPVGSNFIVMPAAEEEVSGLVMRFEMRCTEPVNPERPTLVVGVMTLPYDTASFVAVDTVHPTWDYRTVTVDLSVYSGTGRHIAFRYFDDNYRYTYIDDLRLSRAAVGGLYATAVSDHSVTLHWDTVGYNGTTWVAVDTVGGSGPGDPVAVTGTQLTIDTLLAGKSYRFYLWAEGQDSTQLCQASTVELTTLDAPVVLPYCEDFEGYASGTAPAGWTLPYTMQDLDVQNTVFAPDGGMHALRLPVRAGTSPRVSLAAMPAYSGGSLSDVYADLFVTADYYNSRLTVGVMDDPMDTTTFTEVVHYDILIPAAWMHLKVDLSAYNGTGLYLAFRATTSDGDLHHVYVDNLTLRSCAVTHAALQTPTENSLTLFWTATTGASGVYVEYKPTGQLAGDFVPGAGVTEFVTESPHTFTGLEEATYYTFHVYPACDTVNDGCNYETVSMQTLHPWVDLPYCESFEDIDGEMPNNWVNLTQSGYPYRYSTSSGHNDSASHYLSLYADASGSTFFALPRIYIGQVCTVIDKMYANFWLNFSGGAALFEVGTMTDVNDPTTFVAHDTADFVDQGWQHYTLAITGYNTQNSYVAFRLSSSDGSGVYCDFDDLCMEKCVASNVTVSEITQSSVTITWDNYSVDTLICEYGPQGFALGSGTVVTITESPYTITGLTDGTMYDFTFASICGCSQFGASYTPGGGSWGGSGGWGGYGWGWWCCVPCSYDTLQQCRYWRWGYWHGHSWNWWFSHENGSGNVIYPAIEDAATQAAMMETPYCESFEMDDTVAFPPSWRRESESIYPGLTTINNHSGAKSMRFYATTSGSCYAALPPLEAGTVQQMVMTFYAYSTSNYAIGSNGRFIVGVMSDPDVESTFVPIDTVRLSQAATWEQQVIDFAAYTDTAQYIAFRFAPTGGAYNFFIDDLYIGRCATSNAQLQTGLASVLFPDTAQGTADPYVVKLSWTANHVPDSLRIVYGKQGFTPGDTNQVGSIGLYFGSMLGNMPADTTLPLSVNLTDYGIDPDSSYDFYLVTVCSDTSSGCFLNPLTLNPTLLVPYCEDFEDLPSDDWATNDPIVPSRWTVVRRNQNRLRFPQLEFQDEENIMAFYPSTGTNDNVVMLPPLPNNDSLEGKWVYARFATQYNNSIFLDYGTLTDTTNGGSFVQMGTMNNGSASTYKEMNVQLTLPAGTAGGDRFAIRARSTSGDRWIRLSKIAVSNYPYPTEVSDVAMGVASRMLTWSGEYDNAYYTVEYGYGDNWQTVASDSCGALLTGLEAGKVYTVSFISPAGERLCLPYSFTAEDYQDLPYCETFDTYSSGSMPAGWERHHSRNMSYVYVNGNQELYMYSYQGDVCQVMLPDLAIDSLRHADLRFRLYSDNHNYEGMIVGVVDQRNGTGIFTPIDTVHNSLDYSWETMHVNLSAYQGADRYLTFRMLNTSGWKSIYMDSLVVSPCVLPDLTVYGSDAIMASVEGVEAVDYYIEYAPYSFVQGEGDTVWNADSTEYTVNPTTTTVHVTTNPYYLTGLSPATTYTLYLRCDSVTPTCASPVTLKTSDRAPLPYCDDFSTYDDYSTPTGWSRYHSRNDSRPYVNYNKHVEFYNYYTDSYCQMTLPDLDVDSVKHAEVWLDMYSDNVNDDYMIVGVMTDRNDMSSFVAVDTLRNSSNNSWQQMHPRLSRYEGSGRFIAFRMQSSCNYCSRYAYIDNLRIQTCPRATVSLSDGTTMRLDVDTSLGAPDYWVEYGPQGIVQLGEDTTWNADSTQYTLAPANTILHVTETPYFIGDLEEGTTYDFYVRCDSAVASCFPVERHTTSTQLSLPLCYDFSSYGNNSLPPYWRRYNNNPYSYDYPYVYNEYIEFYNYYSYNICQATLPDLAIDSIRHLGIELSLSVNYTSDGLIVGVMDNPEDIATFTPVDTLYCANTGGWETKTVRMQRYGGTGRFVAFREVSPTNYRTVKMANLRLQSCPQATVSVVAGTTVCLEVDTSLGTPDYWLEYGPQGIVQLDEDTVWNADSTQYSVHAANTLIHVTQSPYLITDLTSGTTYDFYTRCDSAVATCYPVQRHTMSAVLDLPQCFDFSIYANNTMPPYWGRYSNDGSYPNYPYKSDNALRFYKYSTTSICQAVMPDFNIDSVKNLNLTFSIKASYVNDGLIVGVLTDADNPATFVPVDTLRISVANDWQTVKPRLWRYGGTGRFVALRELIASTYRNVYANNFYVETCDIPAGIRATLHGHNIVRIDADTTSSTGFWVEYDTANFAQGTGTLVYCASLPLDLTLENTTAYDFYFRCDTLTLTCRPKQSVTTQSEPQELPLCEDFEGYTTSLPTGWLFLHPQGNSGSVSLNNSSSNAHSGNSCLHFDCYYNYANYAILPDLTVDSLNNLALSFWLKGPTGSSLTVGVLSDPADATSFLPVQTVNCQGDAYVRCLVALNTLPGDARFLAFRNNTPNSCCWRSIYVDDLFIDTVGAADFRVTNIASDEVSFAWNQVGHPAMTIEYGPVGFAQGSGTTVTVSQSPFTLTNLDPLTNHQFYFTAVGDSSDLYCTTNYCDSAAVFTPAGGTGCIDPTNFTADYTRCFYGSFANPYANIGIIDYGADAVTSRHTVHYDTTAYDIRTGGQLRVVPEGSNASVRLGNWNSAGTISGAEAEAIAYTLFVDTTNFDLLVLRYAAVLQDPLHVAADQPRFSLEILDTAYTLLDGQCGAADFVANSALGWNVATDNVLWKDWTTVGVDLSPYAGQQIIIRLTTRDCGMGDHYGYAYFTIGCQQKNMQSELCGDVDSNTFYAPAGFVYRWYTNLDTLDTISTARVLKVKTDTVTYYCECSFVDKPGCQFTISAYAGTRYPLASFNYEVEISDCQFHVNFTNTSTISGDGINPIGSGEPCESARWDFGNGQAATTYHASMVYDSAGTYNVSLISGIAGDECTDTATLALTLTFPPTNYSIDGLQHLCVGDTTTLTVHETMERLWSTGSADTSITLVPDTTTLYRCFVVDSNGCRDTLERLVTVYDNSQYTDNQTTVENLLPYTWNNRVYYADTVDTITLTNIAGCDSTVLFSLHVYYNVADTVADTICESQLPLVWNDSTFTATETKNTLLVASTGADSLLTMQLIVIPTTYDTIFDTIVENSLPYTFLSHTYTTDTLGDTLLLVNAAGCDSLITYSLYVHRNVVDTAYDTVCESQLLITWNNRTFALDTSYFDTLAGAFVQFDTLVASTGADSLLTMQLVVLPTTYDTIFDTIVENSLPYTFLSHTYTTDTLGDTLLLTNAAGCDSLITYSLYVHRNVYDTIYDTVCESQLPYVWNDSTFTASENKTTLLAAATGADSLLTMNLIVIPTTYDTIFDTIVENSLPWTFLTHTYTTDTMGDTLLLVNAAGCDSLITYSLYVHRNIRDTIFDTVCESQLPITWNNRTFALDSSYFDTLTAAFVQLDTLVASTGADSLLTMQLAVLPTTYAVVADTIFENDLPYLFNGTTYTLTMFDADSNDFATLSDTLTILNAAGCDSVVTYSLSVHFNRWVQLDSAVCQSELPIIWNARTFTLDSSYYDTLSAAFVQNDTLSAATGADSIIVMRLTVHETFHWLDTLVVCRNWLPYTWRDTVLGDSTQSGDYFLARLSQYGCDSLMSLSLTMGEVYAYYDTLSVCFDAQPVTWLDTSVSVDSAGLFDVALPRSTELGCDSIYNLSLTVRPVYDIHDTVALCEDALPYSWADTTIAQGSSSLTLSRTFVSEVQCDSVRTLHLTVDTNTYSTVHEYVVENDLPYTYHGLVLTDDTAAAIITFDNAHGCDSIVTYTLTVYHNVSTQVENTVCDDALPLQWNSRTFTAADVATYGNTIVKLDTLTAYTGADSVVMMTLHVNPTYSTTETFGICYDALPYTWHDTVLGIDQTSGIVYRHFLTQAGCDSIFTLNLTVSDVYNVTDNIVSCTPITWIDGVTYDTPTTGPQVTLQSQAGCDSIVTLNFTFVPPVYTYLADSACFGEVYHFGDRDLTSGGLYVDTLKIADGCDSIVSLQLTMLAAPTLTITTDPDCRNYTYTVHVESNVDYLHWTVEPGSWNNDWGLPNSHQLYIRPYGTQTYTATVDYLPETTCPVTKSIKLSPIVVPLAIMNVKPERINYEQPTLTALDQSTGAIWRQWWVNGDDFGGNVRIEFTPDMQEDSVVLMLEVGSEYCTDTAYQVVPIFRHSVFAPNAFTPNENSNKEFYLLLDGVLQYELTIFNRQGIEVFHSLNPEQGWDGTSGGHLCPQGAYVWILKYTTKEMPRVPQTEKGSVLLLR